MTTNIITKNYKHHFIISVVSFILIFSILALPFISKNFSQDSNANIPSKNDNNNLQNNLQIQSEISLQSIYSSSSLASSSLWFTSSSSMTFQPSSIATNNSAAIQAAFAVEEEKISPPESKVKEIIPIFEPPAPIILKPIKPIPQSNIEPAKPVIEPAPILEAPKPAPVIIPAEPVVVPPKIEPLPPVSQANDYTATGCDFGLATQMLELVNLHRLANGSAKLTLVNNLIGVACSHSKWMTSSGVFSHTGKNGTSPFERCKNAGTFCYAENVAYNTLPIVSDLFNQFKDSPGHNLNMLDPQFTEIGIAFDGVYVTQLFR